MATDYGSDLSCRADIDPARVVTGLDLLKDAVYRRATTPRGSVIDAPNYGIDIEELLGRASTAAGLASIPGAVRNEILKDPRIDTCTVTATYVTDKLTLSIHCESAVGPFDLVVPISQVTLELLAGGVV